VLTTAPVEGESAVEVGCRRPLVLLLLLRVDKAAAVDGDEMAAGIEPKDAAKRRFSFP